MQRRQFIKKASIAGLAVGFIPSFGLALAPTELPSPVLVPLHQPTPQIRHGVLNFSRFGTPPSDLPFDWLLQVQRNIFFKNGFQANESTDLEIHSILWQTGADDPEALQIQLEAAQSTLLLGEEWFEVPLDSHWQKIETPHQSQHLYLAHWKAGNYSPPIENFSELYLQVLEGMLSCNGQLLDAKTSLALHENQKLLIEVEEASRVLILAK